MAHEKSIQEIREERAELIRAAIPEQDSERRTALLVQADVCSEVLRERQAEGDAGGI